MKKIYVIVLPAFAAVIGAFLVYLFLIYFVSPELAFNSNIYIIILFSILSSVYCWKHTSERKVVSLIEHLLFILLILIFWFIFLPFPLI